MAARVLDRRGAEARTGGARRGRAAAAEFAEILRKSYWARDGSLRAVAEAVSGILDRWDRREEVVELLDLVNRAAAIMEEAAGAPPEERPALEDR